jgi:pentatricopeptide repeat protein
MTRRMFTSTELAELSTPYSHLIRNYIRRCQPDKALALCSEMKQSQVLLHDFFAESCTVLWSWVGERLGEDAIDAMFRYVFAQSARRQFFDAACAMAPPHLQVLLLAKSWRAHSCFEAGKNPGKFSIQEDPVKFTFHLTPCGSGLRLWRNGWYEAGQGGALFGEKRTWTYQRAGFPYYCIHCPFLNEILPYESHYKTIMWPVDPPENPGADCAWHIYKDRNDIPEAYYKRLGLQKRPVQANKYLTPGRMYFSKSQLAEMSKPTTHRISEKIENGELKEAVKLCAALDDEFLVLHDLYVNMISATLTFIADRSGEKGLEDALRIQFEKCVKQQFCMEIGSLKVKDKVGFLARKVLGVDVCNRTGYHAGRLFVAETDAEIVLTLAPCGSGGRLIRAGVDRPIPRLTKLRERLENFIICSASRYLPLPERLLERVFPLIIKHFTQRKPFDQGKAKKPHSWSFDRSGTPYFCCQCGMLSAQLNEKGITISPPQGKNKNCVWRIDKRDISG